MKSAIRSLLALSRAIVTDPLWFIFTMGILVGFDLRHFAEFVISLF